MMSDETVDETNWPEIAERLPHTMKDIVYNASAWSCYQGASGTVDYPLFIAGRPVVVLPPTWQPEWNEPRFIAAPPDPLSACINPTIPLTTETLQLATETFKEAIAFLKFFDGTFLVVYPAGTDCAAVSTYVPKTFGGMLIQIDSSHFAVPCAAYTGPSAGIDPGNADLALMTPACKLTMEIDLQPNGRRRRFRAASNQLLFNTLICMMTPGRPFPPEAAGSQGQALRPAFGTSIGEALIKANLAFLGSELECKKLKKEAEKQKNEAAFVTQFSRAILWRTAGTMPDLQGRSGTPLEVVETGEVCGFHNFQWRKNVIPRWGRDLEALLAGDDVAVEREAFHVRYPMYGSYMLPVEVEEMGIVGKN